MKLTTSLVIHQEELPKDLNHTTYTLDGDIDSIKNKLVRNFAALVAKHENPEGSLEVFNLRMKELLGRWDMI